MFFPLFSAAGAAKLQSRIFPIGRALGLIFCLIQFETSPNNLGSEIPPSFHLSRCIFMTFCLFFYHFYDELFKINFTNYIAVIKNQFKKIN